MTLINKLLETSKWVTFEKWYNEQKFYTPLFQSRHRVALSFYNMEFEFQKGIFEKFIISHAWTNNGKSYPFFISQRNSLSSPKLANFCLYDIGVRYFETMEDLVLYFFNDDSPEIELV